MKAQECEKKEKEREIKKGRFERHNIYISCCVCV